MSQNGSTADRLHRPAVACRSRKVKTGANSLRGKLAGPLLLQKKDQFPVTSCQFKAECSGKVVYPWTGHFILNW
jgi:hypothetical protein